MRSGASFLLALLAIAAGIGLFFFGGTMNGSDPLALPLVVAGGVAVLAGIVMLIFAWRGSSRRAYAQALAAPDAIARWQVYPSDMEAFRTVDAARAGRLWSLKNSLKLPGSVPPEGFPVIVGRESLLVANKLYRNGIKHYGPPGDVSWHEGEPGFIEITSELPTTKTPRVVVLRIPVPTAEAEDGTATLPAEEPVPAATDEAADSSGADVPAEPAFGGVGNLQVWGLVIGGGLVIAALTVAGLMFGPRRR